MQERAQWCQLPTWGPGITQQEVVPGAAALLGRGAWQPGQQSPGQRVLVVSLGQVPSAVCASGFLACRWDAVCPRLIAWRVDA